METTAVREPGFRGILPEKGICLGDVDRRRDLTEREFREEYLKPRRALILQGEVEQWPAFTKWTLDFFRETYGDLELPTGKVFQPQGAMKVRDFVDYIRDFERERLANPSDDFPRYVEGWYFRHAFPELEQDFRFPPCFGPDWFVSRYPQRINPKGTGILIGTTGSYTKLHVDGQHTHNWLAQISGRKRWMLVDGKELAPVYKTRAEAAGNYKGIDHPDLAAYLEHHPVHYYDCITEPGDLIFFPGFVFHQVVGLSPSVSLTHNWFNGANAARVYYEMSRMRLRGLFGLRH